MEGGNQHKRQYNNIYSKLVSDETDIIGHIAYSLYKAEKVEYLDNLAREKKEIAEEDLKQFHKISCLDTTLDRYKLQASTILVDYLNEVLTSYKEDIKKDYIDNQRKHLGEVVDPLKPKFWNGVFQSIVGAFIFAIILAAFAFVYTFSKEDTSIKTGSDAAKVMKMPSATTQSDSLMIVP
jgi:hypothetical protein